MPLILSFIVLPVLGASRSHLLCLRLRCICRARPREKKHVLNFSTEANFSRFFAALAQPIV